MSISRLALRIVTARALAGVTLAGSRVYDSAVEPIDLKVREQRAPFIVVLTDDHDRQVSGRDLRMGTDSVELVLEVAVATTVRAQSGADEEVIVPHTDEGMEVILDLLGHQITETLMQGQGPWAKLWRDFVMRTPRIMSRRGASVENGLRFAARQMIVTCDTLADPIRGGEMSGPWLRLLYAMEQDEATAGIAALVRYAVEGDVPLTPEALAAATFGLAPETVAAIGEAPVRDAQGALVPLTEVVVAIDGAPDWDLTEEAADEAGA
jgi:hypothetical protein